MLNQEQSMSRQHVFRQVLDCFSSPGSTRTINPDIVMSDGPLLPLLLETLSVSTDRTYLSPKVDEAESISKRVASSTGSHPGQLGEASFVVVMGDELPEALPMARRGVLEFPDEGAMVIALVASLSQVSDHKIANLALVGPGVQSVAYLNVQGVPDNAAIVLGKVNEQFPLGVDVLLIDDKGNIAGIPRSSKPSLPTTVFGES